MSTFTPTTSLPDMDFTVTSDYLHTFGSGIEGEDAMKLTAALETSVSEILDHSQVVHLDLDSTDKKRKLLKVMDKISTYEHQQHDSAMSAGISQVPPWTEGYVDSRSNSPEMKFSENLRDISLSEPEHSMSPPCNLPDSTNDVLEIEKGTRRSTSLSDKRPHLLPPCRVCGAQATGFHYGANTCEACKGFFRRCLLRKKETMHCNKGDKCTIRPGKRNLCVFCRYQKCIQAGMSVEGIKTGRYTYKKRTEDIIELQKLRQQECAVRQETEVQLQHSAAMETAMTVIRSQEKNLEESLQNMQMIYKRPAPEMPVPKTVSTTQTTFADSKKQRLLGLYKSMEKGLIAVVRFAKDLPAFKVLPMADQMKIFKSSTFEVWLIARHRAFNVESSQFSTINGYTILLKDILEADFYDAIIRSVRCLQKLDLTIEETVILKALAYFFTDRCELTRPDLVEDGQEKIIAALELLLRKNHPNDRFILAKVIAALAMLREPSEMLYGQSSSLLQFLDSDVVPLMHEVLNT